MALPLQMVRRCMLLSRPPNTTLARSKFIAPVDPNRPHTISVGLSIISTIAVWLLIIKDRNDHLAEYERRKAKREAQ